jgi:hypothetical protein
MEENMSLGTQQQPATIGGMRVLFYLNTEAVKTVEARGVDWQSTVCYLMARKGSMNELSVSATSVSLSPMSKARCITTPIYRDKAGGIYVLYGTLDDEARAKEELAFLGMVDPGKYAAALCAALGITGKQVYV